MIRLLARKITGERSWSALIVGIMVAGLVAWIMIPSISGSIETGLNNYADSIATWINVSEHGQGTSAPFSIRLDPSVVAQIESIVGVQQAYPVILNGTAIKCFACITINGTKFNAVEVMSAAVLGGMNGYPSSIVSLVAGRMPRPGSAEIITNGPQNNLPAGRPFKINDTATFMFRPQNSSSWEKGLLNVTAMVVGIAAINPVFTEAQLLFDPLFLNQNLGVKLYNQTFGGVGANLIILKARTIQDVGSVANHASALLTKYPSFSVIYDQALLLSLQSFETATIPLYRYIQYVSLASVVTLTLFVINMATGRRRWEVGLLQTQGWSWNKIAEFLFGYYLVLASISLIIGAVISIILGSFLTFQYEVLRGTLSIPLGLSAVSLASAGLIALMIPALACMLSIWRYRQVGLDNVLREY